MPNLECMVLRLNVMVVNVSGAKVIISLKNIAPLDIGSGQGLEFL